MSTLKEFIRDLSSKYAVLDRPPTVSDTKSQPPLSNQASGKPEDLAKAGIDPQKTGVSGKLDIEK